MSGKAYFLGVDVGTGSARAALFTENGKIVRTKEEKIKTWNPRPSFYEQSSDDIWDACVKCIRHITEGIDATLVKGLGFDATCSLVVVDKNGKPLSVSPTGINEQNVILWLDHRAEEEAAVINSLNHPVLKYVGGKISLEMETPKLMWLKKYLKTECYDKAGYFFDLPDFLTWKATGCNWRLHCSLVCKWTYEIRDDGSEGWNKSYFQQIGLEDLLENNCERIGKVVLTPGTKLASGLCVSAAKELDLPAGTPVGASMIDAHAGALGLLGCSAPKVSSDFVTRLALICGTSTCHMAISKFALYVPGIWGPYYSAVVPGMWTHEGGQSASGKLLDFIIETHPATPTIIQKIGKLPIQQYLSNLLQATAKKMQLENVAFLTQDLHVYPDFHGNRSPVADPTLRGMISGLTLSADEENLALLYLAAIQALAYGTRHIVDTLIASGYTSLSSVFICGGLNKNPLFTQTQADVLNLPVVCPDEPESVLRGSAILGACASGYFKDVQTAVMTMGGTGTVVSPKKETLYYHDKKYAVFLEMLKDQKKYREIMAKV